MDSSPAVLPTRRSTVETVRVSLRTMTPIYDGGTITRRVDPIDPIRAPSIRGHLRFWWRALYAGQFETAADLLRAESHLWGSAAASGTPQRSAVDVRVTVRPEQLKGRQTTAPQTGGPAYALWAGRATETGVPPAEMWSAGIEFDVTLELSRASLASLPAIIPQSCPTDYLRGALAAWICFGGYGGRSRRGCGGLTIATSDRDTWLPRISGQTLVLPFLLGPSPTRRPNDVPALPGSTYWLGRAVPDASLAWQSSVDWIRDFRQGTGTGRETARAKGPGRSRWPEGDNMRRFGPGSDDGHPRRYVSQTPVWPRAGFGLPIIARFKDNRSKATEKGTLKWRQLRNDDLPVIRERLASPLIVKPLALADGRYVPLALWLNRANPDAAEVFLDDYKGSAAPFDLLLAPGDATGRPHVFEPLEWGMNAPAGERLKTAFTEWMKLPPRALGSRVL